MNGKGKKEEIQLRLFKIVSWGIYLEPGRMKLQGNGGECRLRTFVICTACQMLLWWSYQEEQCVLVCGVGGGGILWTVAGKLEGTNHLEPLGIDGRVILSGYARNGLSLDWDDLSSDSDLCQPVVKTTVNHWVAWNVWNCLTKWGTVRLSGKILLRGVSDYFV
jgi:hypothetical protein